MILNSNLNYVYFKVQFIKKLFFILFFFIYLYSDLHATSDKDPEIVLKYISIDKLTEKINHFHNNPFIITRFKNLYDFEITPLQFETRIDVKIKLNSFNEIGIFFDATGKQQDIKKWTSILAETFYNWDKEAWAERVFDKAVSS